MLTADTKVQFRTSLAAKFSSHLHQLADTDLVDTGEGIAFIDLIVVVSTKKLGSIVTAEAEGHLGQIVGAEGEELGFFGNLVRSQRSSGNFDHRTNQILQLLSGLGNQVVRYTHDDILDILEFLRFANQRNHDLRNEIPVGMTGRNGQCRLNYGSGLHLGNFRIGNRQAAAAVPHHGVELMQATDDLLDLFDRLAFHLGQGGDVFFLGGNELMQRGIQETNGDRIAFHGLIKAFKVLLLHRLKLFQGGLALFLCICADHLAEGSDAVGIKEHVLGTGQADALCAQFTRLGCVKRGVGIGTNLKAAITVGPFHNAAEFAGDAGVHRRNDAVINIAGRTVDGDPVTLVIGLASQGELLVLLIHLDGAAAGHAAAAHAAGNNRCMAGHAAAHSQNTLGCLHAFNILRAGLQTDQNDFFLALIPGFGVLGSKDDLAAGGAGRCAEAFADRGCGLQLVGVELRVKQGVEGTRLNHGNGTFLIDHAFIYEVAGNLQRCLCGTLAAAALQHVELAVFHGEFHILHVAVVFFEKIADLYELLESFGKLVGHFRDGHRGTDAGNDIFTLRVGQEFAEQLLLAGSRVTGKRNTGTGVLVQVAEDHRHHVDSGTPGVRDVIVAAVDIGARVVPGTEHRTDGFIQLHLRVRREVAADLLLVFCLELLGQCLQISGRQFDIIGNAFLCLHGIDQLFKVLLADFHDDVGKHLDETAVGVIDKTLKLRIGIALDHGGNHFVIQPEIQDGIHHARHGSTSAGAHGNQQRILQITELLSVDLLHLFHVFHDLGHNLIIDLAAVSIILGACFGGNGKALGNRKADVAHFGKVGTFSAEELTHGCIAF